MSIIFPWDSVIRGSRTDSALNDLMSMVLMTLHSAIYVNPAMKEVYTKILPMIESEDLSKKKSLELNFVTKF